MVDETDEAKLLKLIDGAIAEAKKACREAETVMRTFYGDAAS